METSRFYYTENTGDAELSDWLTQCQQAFPAFGLFAMVAEQDLPQVSELQALCRDRQIALAGGVFPQLIWQDQLHARGILLYALRCNPSVLLLEDINDASGRPQPAALDRLTDFADASAEGGRLLTLFDGLVPNISSILQAVYAAIGDKVGYMGVAAGSERFQPMPCLFDNDRLVGNGVLAMRLPPTARIHLECGYSVPSELMPSTSSTGNRIEQIDWRPAFDVYVELVQRHYGVHISQENFYQHAVHFPFGVIRADGEVLVRIPVALQDDGALVCVGEIPPNSLLTVVHAIEPGDLSSAERLAKAVAQQQKEQALLFYCAGRRMHLGDQAVQEIQHLSRAVQPTQLAGALTLGEVGSAAASHFPLFYNATLVVIAGLCR